MREKSLGYEEMRKNGLQESHYSIMTLHNKQMVQKGKDPGLTLTKPVPDVLKNFEGR